MTDFKVGDMVEGIYSGDTYMVINVRQDSSKAVLVLRENGDKSHLKPNTLNLTKKHIIPDWIVKSREDNLAQDTEEPTADALHRIAGECEELKGELGVVELELEGAKIHASRMESDAGDLEKRLSARRRQCGMYKKRSQDAKEELETARKRIGELETDRDFWNLSCNEARKTFLRDGAGKEAQDAFDSLKAEHQLARRTCDELNRELKQTILILDETRINRNNWRGRAERAELSIVNAGLEEVAGEENPDVSDIQAINDCLYAELKEMKQTCNDLSVDIIAAHTERDELVAEAHTEGELPDYYMERLNLSKRLQESKQEVKQLREEVSSTVDRMNFLTNRNIEQSKKLKDTENARDFHEQRYKISMEDRDNLREKLTETESGRDFFMERLDVVNRKLELTRIGRDDYREDCKELRADLNELEAECVKTTKVVQTYYSALIEIANTKIGFPTRTAQKALKDVRENN